MLETDFRYALRLLAKTPRFTAFCLSVLVGGLTISLFTFAVLYTVTYKPLTIPDGESVLDIDVDGLRGLPAYEFQQVREEVDLFAEVGVWEPAELRLSQGQVGRTLAGSRSEWNLFEFARTQPVLGRGLQPQDAQPGAEAVAVVSFRIWNSIFNGDEQIIGSTIQLNNEAVQVVGVMPDLFNFPVSTDIWLPLGSADMRPPAQGTSTIRAYARLRPGVKLEEANARLTDRLNNAYQQSIGLYDKQETQIRSRLQSFPTMQMANTGGVFAFFFINLIAFFILLLACINVGNLLLARAIQREKETAVRAALGAPPARLVSQLMWEGGLLTMAGGVISLAIVGVLVKAFNVLIQSRLAFETPFWWVWQLEWPTVVVAIGFSLLTLFLACFLPAWKASRQDLNNALRDGTRGAQGRSAGRLSRGLVVVQVTLITALMLIGSVSAYMVHVFTEFDTGFDLERLLEARLVLPDDRYNEHDQRSAFYQEVVTRLKREPSVADAHVRSYFRRSPTRIDGRDGIEPRLDVFGLIGSPKVQGIELLEGRYIDQRDNANNRRTVVVSRSFANRYWAGGQVLDQYLNIQVEEEFEAFQVVGVVSDTINLGNIFHRPDKDDELYVSGTEYVRKTPKIFIKYEGEVERAKEALYQVIFGLDRAAQVSYVISKKEELEKTRGLVVTARNVTFFAALFSLGLAISGVYGLTANSIVRRTHEIGIRRAVGAPDEGIVALLLRQASRQLALGLALGVGLFGLISFALNSFTEGSVPIAFYLALVVGVVVLLGMVVGAAVYLPSRQSVRLEPGAALRYE